MAARLLIQIATALGIFHAAAHAQSTTMSSSPSGNIIHRVDVGEDGLVFEPNVTRAEVGDKIEFHFYQGMHSVARASFDTPCVPVNGSGAIYSGRVPVNSGEGMSVFTVDVRDTSDPIWFYCATQDHCQDGMVGVINPPNNNDETLEKFASAAADAQANIAPSSTGGGELGAAASVAATATTMTTTMTGSESASGTSSGAETSSTGDGGSGAADLRVDMELVMSCFGIAVASLIVGMMM